MHDSVRLAHSGDWAGSLDAARRANLLLFGLHFLGDHTAITQNYLVAARALFNLGEWHESSILANLSLKGLQAESDKPNRAGALILLAKALNRHRDVNGARAALAELRGLLLGGATAESDQAEAGLLAQDLGMEWP